MSAADKEGGVETNLPAWGSSKSSVDFGIM